MQCSASFKNNMQILDCSFKQQQNNTATVHWIRYNNQHLWVPPCRNLSPHQTKHSHISHLDTCWNIISNEYLMVEPFAFDTNSGCFYYQKTIDLGNTYIFNRCIWLKTILHNIWLKAFFFRKCNLFNIQLFPMSMFCLDNNSCPVFSGYSVSVQVSV